MQLHEREDFADFITIAGGERSVNMIDPEMKKFFDTNRTDTSFAPEKMNKGLQLWQDTKGWIEKNLWVR